MNFLLGRRRPDPSVKILCHFNGANEATTTVDSACRRPISFVSDAKLSTSKYKFGVSSLSLSGTDDYISVPASNAFNFSADWEVSCWLNINAWSSNMGICGQYVDANNWWGLNLKGGATRMHFVFTGGAYWAEGSPIYPQPIGTWQHFVFGRQGSIPYIFVDGRSYEVWIQTSTGTIPVFDSPLYIGRGYDYGYEYVNAYMDEFRLACGKGFVNLSPDYLVPSSAGAPDGSDAMKLCLSGEGADASTTILDTAESYNAASSANQLSSSQKVFGSTSGYYNGSSYSMFSATDSNRYDLGTGDFTIDFRVMFTSATWTDVECLFDYSGAASPATNNISIYKDSSSASPAHRICFYAIINGTVKAFYYTSSWTPSKDTWYHFAWVRTGTTTMKFFVDGVEQTITASTAVGSNSLTLPESYYIFIGAMRAASTTYYLTGYLDEYRLSVGYARWTTGFTKPSAAYDTDVYTKLLLHYEKPAWCWHTTCTHVVDSSGRVPTAVGNAQIDTAQYKWGSASILFDGSGDYLTLPDDSYWNLSNYQWSFSFFVRFNSLTNAQDFMGQYDSSSLYWYFRKDSNANGNKLSMKFYNSGAKGDYVMTNSWSPNTGQWYHIAFVRCAAGPASAGYIFIDGVSQALTVNTAFGTNSLANPTGLVTIGCYNSANYLDGWLDDVRFCRGYSYYPPLTPPTAAYYP